MLCDRPEYSNAEVLYHDPIRLLSPLKALTSPPVCTKKVVATRRQASTPATPRSIVLFCRISMSAESPFPQTLGSIRPRTPTARPLHNSAKGRRFVAPER